MAQVTYRGVKYDSEQYRNMVLAEAQQRNHDLMYRGLKVVRKVAGGKQMLEVTEILAASVVFLMIIYAEARFLYSKS